MLFLLFTDATVKHKWPLLLLPLNAATAIELPPHRRHCMPSSSSTATTAATSATAAATCVVDSFTLVHDKERGSSSTTTSELTAAPS